MIKIKAGALVVGIADCILQKHLRQKHKIIFSPFLHCIVLARALIVSVASHY